MQMRLLVISHTPHYVRDGEIVGWGATVRELDQLGALFDSVVHIAPLEAGPAPGSCLPYTSPRIGLRAVRPAGGNRLRDKIRVPLCYPGYLKAILHERSRADLIHVRAPANISLLALVILGCLSRPKLRWAKYAGDWNRGSDEPWSYRFQRWWLLRGLHRGWVTVNGSLREAAPHVRTFLNPCLMDSEIYEGLAEGGQKTLSPIMRLVFVGRVESAKGVGICLDTVALLRRSGIPVELDMVGDGPQRPEFERKAKELGLDSEVIFHGELPRQDLGRFYGKAHFILLPSASEGWPKVLSEAMAYGVVPIASAVGSIPEYLRCFGTGLAVPNASPAAYASAIAGYSLKPDVWKAESQQALIAAGHFTYSRYLQALTDLLGLRKDVTELSCHAATKREN